VGSSEQRDSERAARERMVAEQIESRGIRDPRVLEAFRTVPRHRFVPENFQDEVYADGPLPIGYDQTISQPYIVAYMTDSLAIDPEDRVLEIGTGSGYQTAVLAELAREVFTVELVHALAAAAEERLRMLGYKNIFFRTGNGWDGWAEQAPFDKVIVTAAAPEIPEPLVQQLKEGGRLIIPVGREQQVLMEGEKCHGILKKDWKIPVRFVPLINPGKKS